MFIDENRRGLVGFEMSNGSKPGFFSLPFYLMHRPYFPLSSILINLIGGTALLLFFFEPGNVFKTASSSGATFEVDVNPTYTIKCLFQWCLCR